MTLLWALLRGMPVSTFTAWVLAIAGLAWMLLPRLALGGCLGTFWTMNAAADWLLAAAIILCRAISRSLG